MGLGKLADIYGARHLRSRRTTAGMTSRKPCCRRDMLSLESEAWTIHGDGTHMDLRMRVNSALKQAMIDKAAVRLATLRLINAAIKDQDIAKRGETGDDSGVDDAQVLAILGKMTKQRQESARAYEEGGRLDLAERELEEIGVISEFLPRQLDEAETEAAVDAAVAATGAQSIRDMGKVMAELKSRHTGQMDFAKVGPMVKGRLCTGSA